MNKILVCLQHELTEEQERELSARGQVLYLKDQAPDLFKRLSNIQPNEDLKALAKTMQMVIQYFEYSVEPIGSPEFNYVLNKLRGEHEADGVVLTPTIFARSLRESIEEKLPDGSVKKTIRFKHLGFSWPDGREGGDLYT